LPYHLATTPFILQRGLLIENYSNPQPSLGFEPTTYSLARNRYGLSINVFSLFKQDQSQSIRPILCHFSKFVKGIFMLLSCEETSMAKRYSIKKKQAHQKGHACKLSGREGLKKAGKTHRDCPEASRLFFTTGLSTLETFITVSMHSAHFAVRAGDCAFCSAASTLLRRVSSL
jgi:hypothetical protein